MAILVFSPNGTHVTKPTLEAARTSADCAGKTVVVTSALTAAQSDITAAWPADRALEVKKGGSIGNTAAFTINGSFSAALSKVFSGTGSVTFGAVTIKEVYPQWWGAKGDGVTDDSLAVQNAFNCAFPSGQSLHFPSGTYLINTQVIWSTYGHDVRIFGAGDRTTIIKSTNTAINGIMAFQGPSPELDGAPNRLERTTIEDMGFLGTGSGIGSATGLLIYGAQNTRLSNVTVSGFVVGIQFHNTDLVIIENSHVNFCSVGITTLGTGYAPGTDANSFIVTDSCVAHCSNTGIAHNGGESTVISGGNFVANGKSIAIANTSYSSVTSNAVIDANYFEGDTSTSIQMGGGSGIVRGGRITNNTMLVTANTVAMTIGNVSNATGRGFIGWNTMSVVGGTGTFTAITQANSPEKWDYNSFNATVIGDVTPASGTFTTVKSGTIVKSAAASAAVDLLSIGSYGSAASIKLTVLSSSAGIVTVKTYAVVLMGAGNAVGSINILAAEDYAGGASAFTLSEVVNSPVAGTNSLRLTNNSTATCNFTVTYTLDFLGGTLTLL